MNWKIPLFKIYWDEEDIETVTEAIKAGMNWAVGPNIERFEKMITEYIGTKYCLTFNSGTSALHALLLAYGVGEGDEVIVPSFTFIATANAPLFVGAKPVFADIEGETFGLDPEDVKKKITKKTKAIIPIHYGGYPCKIEELREIVKDNNLILIEDVAESFGARIGNKKVGAFGDSAMFSFCQNKVITTGEGGAIVTESKGIYEKLKLIRSHGRLETQDYFSSTEYMDYVRLGYNFRISNISAALGISQLKKIEKIIEMRRRCAEYLDKALVSIKEIVIPIPLNDYHNVYQMYPIIVSPDTRDTLIRYLAEKGIMTKVYFSPVHLSYFYKEKLKYKYYLPVTEKVAKEILSLPIHPTLTMEEINYMVSRIKNFFEGGS